MAETGLNQDGLVRFGAFELDLRSGELRKSGIRIKLQEQPFRVLAMLLDRPGELVTRSELKERIWPNLEFGDFDHSVNLCVNKVRAALGDSSDAPRFVETLHRRGYRFVAPVDGIAIERRAPGSAPVPSAVVTSARRRLLPLVLGASICLLLAAFTAWKLWPHTAIESLAVLPFTTDDPALQYLGDGIAETLTDNLSQISNLHVLSRNSAFQLRATQPSTRELARRLGVRGLVIGSVTRNRQGDLRITVELVDGREDHHIWGNEYRVGVAQLASAQTRIAQDVFLGLRYQLDAAQRLSLGHRYTSNPEAYDAYLRGSFAVRNRNLRMIVDSRSARRLPDAAKFFEEATRLDPGFARAYAGLEAAYGIAAALGLMRPSEALPLAQAATERALQLDPEMAEAHIGAAYMQLQVHHNVIAAIAEAERAAQLDPDLPEAHHAYAQMLFVNRQFDLALQQETTVVRLDPEWPIGKPACINILLYAGRYAEAEERVRALQPYNPNWMAVVRIYQHRYEDAIRELSASKPGQEKPHAYPLAWAQARLGKPDAMRQLLQSRLNLRQTQYVPSSRIAADYAVLQDRAQTLAWIKTAIEEDDPGYFMSTLEDRFAFLWQDPEYQQLRRRMFISK